MNLISIIMFVIILYGLGHAATRFLPLGKLYRQEGLKIADKSYSPSPASLSPQAIFLKNNSLDTMILRIGIGLGMLPFLGLCLNFIHAPLDWRIFLVLSLAVPLYDWFLYLKEQKLRGLLSPPSKHTLLVLGIFCACLVIYCQGPFSYPWLENDDSWTHAAGIKYIALEKNINVPAGVFFYINPYPPGYDLIFGIIHQIHPSLYWSLKFFNGLIVSFGFLFFYVFVKELTGNKNKALLSLFFLACLPCYLSHFIWAHALAVTLFFPALYAALRAGQDRRFILPGSLVISGILLTQPSQAVKFAVMLLLLVTASALFRRKGWQNMLIPLLVGGVLSLIWWGPRLYDMKTGNFRYAVRNETLVSGAVEKSPSELGKRLFDPKGGTATRTYTVEDYFIARKNNMINNPVGVGPVICLLALWGIFYSIGHIKNGAPEDKIYGATTLAWLVFTFLGMNSATFHLPIGLFAFRFWMLFAIPVSMLAAEAFDQAVIRKERSALKTATSIIVLTGVLATSGYYKFRVNTSPWPWGIYWNSPREIRGYVWLRHHLPPNTKVFAFTDNLFVIGNDMRADFWSGQYQKSFNHAVSLPPDELSRRLKHNGFQYVIIGEREVRKFGSDTIKMLLEGLTASGRFKLTFRIEHAVWIFEVV